MGRTEPVTAGFGWGLERTQSLQQDQPRLLTPDLAEGDPLGLLAPGLCRGVSGLSAVGRQCLWTVHLDRGSRELASPPRHFLSSPLLWERKQALREAIWQGSGGMDPASNHSHVRAPSSAHCLGWGPGTVSMGQGYLGLAVAPALA